MRFLKIQTANATEIMTNARANGSRQRDKSKIKVNGRSGKACGVGQCTIAFQRPLFSANNAPDLTKGSRSGSPGLSLSTWRGSGARALIVNYFAVKPSSCCRFNAPADETFRVMRADVTLLCG